MAEHLELDARCAHGLFKVLGDEKQKREARRLAHCCGYAAYPQLGLSPLLSEEPELESAFRDGWRRREDELRPRTDEELAQTIEDMNRSVLHGSGQFYELYEQRFSDMAEDWLERLSTEERERALILLKPTCYNANRTGYWSYDVEENDITFHQDGL